jgi:uncharacterized membrane protein
MARAGVVILFFGFAFLLKYSYQHIQMPIELRLAAVALGAVLLLVIGWRLRLAREAYGLALQGGGVGLLYLTIFSALRLYGLLPAAPAFALLLAVVALSALLAVLQDSLALAMLGAAGGFLAPILTSTGEGSHVALFSYYAVLNVGILAIAWFKAWRLLNLLGFVFTFGIATLWGSLHYRPDLYASTEPFLLLFFLIYVAIAVLFARRAAGPVERHLDTTLVFGVPLISFGLQVGLVREFTYGSAWSALVLGAFYLLLARTLWSRRGEGQRLLVEAFLALGVVFATLAIPLAFDGRWTSAAWAIEGAAIVWVGVRQQRLPARLFGILLAVACRFLLCTTRVYGGGRLAGAQQRLPGRPAAGAGGPVLRMAVAAASAGTAPGRALARPAAVCLGHRLVGCRRPARDRSPCAPLAAGQRGAGLFHRLVPGFQRLERACTGRRRATRRWRCCR